IEEAYADRIHPQREALAIDGPFVAAQVGRFGELQAHVRLCGAWHVRRQAHAEPGQALAFDQLAEMGLRGLGNLDHGAILSSPHRRGCPPCPTSFPSFRPTAFPVAAANTACRKRACANCCPTSPAGNWPRKARRWCAPSASRTTTGPCPS